MFPVMKMMHFLKVTAWLVPSVMVALLSMPRRIWVSCGPAFSISSNTMTEMGAFGEARPSIASCARRAGVSLCPT